MRTLTPEDALRGDPTAHIHDDAARSKIASCLVFVRREAAVVIALIAVAAAWFLLPRMLHRDTSSPAVIDSTQVRQIAAANIRRESVDPSGTVSGEPLQLRAHVTPSDGVVVVRIDLERDDDVEVVVCSLGEEHVRTLWRGMLQAGETVLTWDRRTPDGREAPAGDYVVMASASGHRVSARFVVPSAR